MTIDKDSLYRYDTSLLRDAVQRAGFDPDCPGPFALKSRINLGTVERILSGHTKGMSKERAELIKGTTAMMICRYLRIEPHELCPGAPQPMPRPSAKKLPDYENFEGFNDWRTHDDARMRRKFLRDVEDEERVAEITGVA
jgi:hypothetical protein